MTSYRKIFLAILITITTLLAVSAYCFSAFALRAVTARCVGGAFISHAVSYADRFEVLERLTTHINSCCECVVKGLAAAPAASFAIPRSEVSLEELHRHTQTLCLVLGLLLLPVLRLCYLLSGVIARRLSPRLAQINAKTSELVGLQDLSLRLIPMGLVEQVPIEVQDICAEKSAQDSLSGPRILIIADDTMLSWARRKQRQRLGLAELVTFPSMEACAAVAPGYSRLDPESPRSGCIDS